MLTLFPAQKRRRSSAGAPASRSSWRGMPKGLTRPELSAAPAGHPSPSQSSWNTFGSAPSLSRAQFATLYRIPAGGATPSWSSNSRRRRAITTPIRAHADHGLEIVAYALKLRQSICCR